MSTKARLMKKLEQKQAQNPQVNTTSVLKDLKGMDIKSVTTKAATKAGLLTSLILTKTS